MSQRINMIILDTVVDLELSYSNQIDDWRVTSWWTDNDRITHRDVVLAADDVIAEHGEYWEK